MIMILQVLKVFPNPITVTTVQFAVGSILVFLMWTLNIHKRPKISGAQVFISVLWRNGLVGEKFPFFMLNISLLAASSYLAIGYGAHVRESIHKHESWKSCCFVYPHNQSYGTIFLGCSVCHVLRRGIFILLTI